jgi:hypothetical protein
LKKYKIRNNSFVSKKMIDNDAELFDFFSKKSESERSCTPLFQLARYFDYADASLSMTIL